MPILNIFGTNASDTYLVNTFTYPGTYSRYQIFANGGNDVIAVTGTISAEIYGGDGDDTMIGGRGNDTIYGDNGNDVIFGGRGADYILGGDGSDIVNAGNGADTVHGGKGHDLLNGAGGDDNFSGGHGNDTINGGSGDDFIFGSKGNNDLFGGVGNDTVNTGDHTSSADGGEGDDLIVARMKKGGDHTLTGGTGADTFEFVFQDNRKSADVVITDFELGQDDFSVGGVDGQTWVDTNFAFAETFGLDLLTEVDGNAVLDIGSNDTVTFEGVSEADFLAFYVDSGLLLG